MPSKAQTPLAPLPSCDSRSGFILDYKELDLSHALLTREQVCEILPHRGEIVQLDAILWHLPGYEAGIAVKHVRHDEFWVKGHFPSKPVLPGVLMVEAGAQLSSYLFYKRLGVPCVAGFTRIEDTTFRGAVSPGDDLLLLCREVHYRPRRFITRIQGVVDDKLVFESKITGMVLNDIAPTAL